MWAVSTPTNITIRLVGGQRRSNPRIWFISEIRKTQGNMVMFPVKCASPDAINMGACLWAAKLEGDPKANRE